MQNDMQDFQKLSRRFFLKATGAGFGWLAFSGLSTLAAQEKQDQSSPLAPRAPHFPAKAKRVIFLCMEGGPTHLDTFDWKPKLVLDTGKTMGKGRQPNARLFGSPFKFKRSGQSGLFVSELYSEVAKHADRMCLLHGMQTDVPNHPPAFAQLHTGVFQFPRPSVGAWVLYGLGTENQNLPGFVTISPPAGNGGPANYGSSFLPAIYQGTPIGRNNQPITMNSVSNLSNPRRSKAAQREQLDFVQDLNRAALKREKVDPGVEGVIESFELAFRMQGDLPKVMNLDQESAATKKLYGIDDDATDDFGKKCLFARRLIEAGVRFVEVTQGGWDHHRNLREDLTRLTRATDKPIAGLLTDLESRGLLKDTLVIWGGEFGRTPYAQSDDGRDHNSRGYTMWMAGGGTKGGYAHGATDDYGYEAVDGKVHVHDLHATILHLLGLDHDKLIYKYAGREMKLTDLKGNVVKEVVA